MLSFEDLYISYSPEVYRFSVWLSGNKADAEDITAETFTRAWVNLAQIRTETLKAYLFTIARNIFLESKRKRHEHEDLPETFPDTKTNPEKIVELQSELDQIRGTLLSLPEADRSAFVMRVQQDLPYEEIARVLNISETAAKVKVHRARKFIFANHSKKD